MLLEIAPWIGEKPMGFVAISLFLPVAAAAGCGWIWLQSKAKPTLLLGIREVSQIAMIFFPPFLLLILFGHLVLWELRLVGSDERPDMWDVLWVLYAPAWTFTLCFVHYRFSGREMRRRHVKDWDQK